VGEQLPGNHIRNLLLARDGTLWIATFDGLASWKDGKLKDYPETAGQKLFPLLQDHEGTVWFGSSAPGKLCAVQSGKVQCDEAGSFGRSVSAIYEDRTGNLWVSAETGLWRWKPGPPERYSLPGRLFVDELTEGDNGTLLLATVKGLKQFAGGKIQSYALPGGTAQFRPTRFFRSSDGSLWIGSQKGLWHWHQGRTDSFGTDDGFSGDVVNRIFEDREGNVWVATLTGLDRFRDYAVRTISRNQGLSTSAVYSVQATADGTVWIGTLNGLNRWQNGHATVYAGRAALSERAADLRVSQIESLGQDDSGRVWVGTTEGVFRFESDRFTRVPGMAGVGIFGIAGDGQGNVWISSGKRGLFFLTSAGAVQEISWSRFGQKSFGGTVLPDRYQGGVWLGFVQGGVTYFKDGQIRGSYTSAEGLGGGQVSQLRFGSGGAVWAATEGGLSRVKDGHVETLTSNRGLPCDAAHWSVEDDDHAMWVYMSCGLVRIEASDWHAWADDPRHIIKTKIFDNADGVVKTGLIGSYGPHVTKSPDGTLWFATPDGVSVVNPRHLPFNKLPPPVHIEQITDDRKTYDPASYENGQVPLPARSRDLQIDYTALSLVVPEKVRFRYKLEGRDSDWQDAGNRRQAFYSDLPPRNYRFRVMACNNSGVWNEEGASLDFSIAPAYYQTTWFRLSCVAALLAMLWALYQFRLHQLQQRFNAGLEARVNERTRIARELHDSLLQGFQGLMFRLQAARQLLPERPTEAIRVLDIALEGGDKAIAEGRDTVSDLREPIVGDKDLSQALTALGKELGRQSENGTVPSVRVLVEGEQRDLDPLVRDEVYRIAREALRNTFRHAKARKVEAEITYRDSEFTLHVRDDGIGIAPAVANQGARAGHWGLPGMRERAEKFGGKLEVWSEEGAGTEIALTIPGSIAYGKSNVRSGSWFPRRRLKE